jgi:hypothetical protein
MAIYPIALIFTDGKNTFNNSIEKEEELEYYLHKGIELELDYTKMPDDFLRHVLKNLI